MRVLYQFQSLLLFRNELKEDTADAIVAIKKGDTWHCTIHQVALAELLLAGGVRVVMITGTMIVICLLDVAAVCCVLSACVTACVQATMRNVARILPGPLTWSMNWLPCCWALAVKTAQ